MRKTHLVVLAVAAVAIVLAIGAVSAYADLASDTQAPVTTTDTSTNYWNVAVITATAIDDEGIAYIYHEFDEGVMRRNVVSGSPTSDTLAIPTAQDSPLAVGKHTLKYWAQDINGNVEAQHVVKFTVSADLAKPVTTATGAIDGGWYRRSVTVNLAAADGESGVEQISYAFDGAAPTVIAAETAAATLTVDAVTVNGPHALVYQATDVAGNVEVAKTLTINVDTKKPTTFAPAAASVVKGRTATLKYKVADALPNGGKATVKVVIKSGTKVVKTVKVGKVLVNKTLYAKFTCRLARGKYRFFVYATDTAGNAQAKIGSNRLTVR